MWNPRHVLVSIFLCLLAGSLLFGCRAFEPEAIIVNREPETYLIGSPAETSGAYFHFHVYWYGTDADGYVERFVWALTDTSIQDYDTDDDEEDLNFNPATNISTLGIGTYTTRTDTVFDFQIGQGANLSYDMTLHMVAIDDRGDFDRTPARLHFFANALGNPRVQFYRDELAGGNEFADLDTVAYGAPLFLKWSGTTPNLAAYDPELLAQRDTVAPFDDGLLGFKWRLPNDDNDCNDAQEDCWRPRALNEATGDSFSYFGAVTELTFLNDGSGSGVFGRTLDAGRIDLLVNTLDVAGVEVPATNQLLRIIVNYDPDTYILRGEQDPEHNDPKTYPYYVVFHGPEAGEYTFAEGDTVPDRSYVVFKALGWDDERDSQEFAENRLTFQGQFIAGQNIRVDGVYYEFSTSYSDTHQTPEWTADVPTDVSSDTLGFEVGPFDYSVIMRAVDEQGTRDGTPDTFSFVGNYPPCVQCVEVGSTLMEASFTYDEPCYDQTCLDDVPALKVYQATGDPRYNDTSDPTVLRQTSSFSTIYVRPEAGQISFEEPVDPSSWVPLFGQQYAYLVYLHGKDHPREHWAETGTRVQERVKSWRYEIRSEQDPSNSLIDGPGADNINFLSGFSVQENNPDPLLSDFYIETSPPVAGAAGAWVMKVTVGVPFFLATGGPAGHWSNLKTTFATGEPAGNTQADTLAWQSTEAVQLAYKTWQLTTMQFAPHTIDLIAADNSTCDWRRDTNAYHFYQGTRIPSPNGRRCEDGAYEQPSQGIYEQGNIDLVDFIAYSNDQVPVQKNFEIELYAPANAVDPFVPGSDPPGWIATGKSRQISWR
jgi:hypothetical protein